MVKPPPLIAAGDDVRRAWRPWPGQTRQALAGWRVWLPERLQLKHAVCLKSCLTGGRVRDIVKPVTGTAEAGARAVLCCFREKGDKHVKEYVCVPGVGSRCTRGMAGKGAAMVLAAAFLLALPSVFISVPALASATPVTITLTQGVGGYSGCADTMLRELYPYENYGASADMFWVRHRPGYDRNILIRFDLTGQLPSGACIKEAKLRLYQYEDELGSSDWLRVGAYRMLKNWDEGTGGDGGDDYLGASWYYRHTGGMNQWYNAGARGVTSDTNSDRHHTHHVTPPYVGVADDHVECTEGIRWVEWDVTPSVQYWVGNPSENFGICLDKWVEDPTGQYHSTSLDGVNFLPREHPDGNYRPRLVITYVIPTAEAPVTLRASDLSLNFFDNDPGITFSQNGSLLQCGGTTSDTSWNGDGSATTYTINSSFEATALVKLQQGIVNANRGQFSFGMVEPVSGKYVRIGSIGYSAHYYEISGMCAASGNGEAHDGSAYWASYWDDVYPLAPPSAAVRFYSETPEDEAAAYLAWKIRYDKPNGMFYVYVNDALVTYYSRVNLTNWRLAFLHQNDVSGVPTTVLVSFPDTTPPSPDPMTWATPPWADSTSSISMTATTATDVDSPPVSYYVQETSGNTGGSSSGWIASTAYTDSVLQPNTRYAYRVKARDSYSTPNETAYSTSANAYTLMPRPTGAVATLVKSTEVNLSATGSFPNLAEAQSGVKFTSPTPGGSGGIDEWIKTTTDTATGLTPNTEYIFDVKARNGDGVETPTAPVGARVRTLAAPPAPLAYNPVSCQGIQANWGSNGNPAGTEYECIEVTTHKSSGWSTAMSWTLGGLEPGVTYSFIVRARNADMVVSPYVLLGEVTTNTSIGQAKTMYGIGQKVSLGGKVVTAVFEDQRLFFVQDAPLFGWPEGGLGIAVRFPEMALPLIQGQVVDITGTLAYNDPPHEQELIVAAGAVLLRPFPLMAVPAYRGSGKTLGGGDYGIQPLVYDDVTAPVAKPSYGLNTVGRLVTTFGKPMDGGQGGMREIWLDDGSCLNDGQEVGVRVDLSTARGELPEPWREMYLVTGVMRCMVVEGPIGESLNVRVLWPRFKTDIVPLE